MAANAPKLWTAADVVAALKTHYPEQQYAVIEQVGNGTGYGTSRHLDVVIMGLWPSRGHDLIGVEVKVSRADWRRELKRPDKAEEMARRMDFFYVAAPKGVIPPEEVPAKWGLLEVTDKGKVMTTQTAIRQDTEPITLNFLAAILRGAAMRNPTRDMQVQARADAMAEAKRHYELSLELEKRVFESQLREMRERIADFERESGIKLVPGSRYEYGFPSGEALGKAVHYIARNGPQKIESTLRAIDNQADRLKEITGAIRAEIDLEG